jgi:group I intron endonuclease
MGQSGIYQIQSKIKPERIYIGSAIDISKRWKQHLTALKKNKHINKKLQNHLNKYGEHDFQFSILLGCDKDDLIKIEQYFLDTYRTYFNTCKIAGSTMGIKFSLETRKKLSKVKRGQVPWNKGKHLSEKHKEGIAKSQQGENNSFFNKRHSERTLTVMRVSNKKAWETRKLKTA